MKRLLWIAVFTWGCVTDVSPAADIGPNPNDGGGDAAISVMQTLDEGISTDTLSPPSVDGAVVDAALDDDATSPEAPMDAGARDAFPESEDADPQTGDAAPEAEDADPQTGDAAPEDGDAVIDAEPPPADMALPQILYDPLPLCINEFAPKVSGYGSDSPLDWIELFNPTLEDINLEGWHISDDRQAPNKHAFGDLVVPAGGALVLYADTQPDRGPDHLPFRLAAGGEEILLTAPDGRGQLVTFGALPGDVTPARVPDCCIGDGCWQLDYLGTPGRGNILAGDEELRPIVSNSAWRFFIGEVGDDWQGAAYDEREWGEGDGPLGWGDDHMATQIERPGGVITAYFRKTFELNAVEGLEEAVFTLLVDDGAVVYLNGQEVIRARMPAGEIRPNTLAAETAGGAAETARTPYPVPVAHFVAGENIIAVEVHQAAPNSSDLGFDGALWIRRITSADPAPPPPPSPDLVRGEAVPIPADFSAWLFTHDVVHRVELVLPQRSVDALNLVPQTLAVSEVRIDGQRVVETGVRLRGSGDAFRPLADKPRLQLDFDHFAPDRTFYGLTSLTLNNSAGDCSRMREVMAHDVFAAAGLPTPRAAFAHVFVNGEDYGLYVLVESQDEVWLQRHYAEADGTLYDGGPVPNERGEPVFLDLERALIPLFPRLAGENDRRADLREVVEAVEGNAGRPTFYDAVGEVVDWEIFHKHAAAEIWTGHGLGYLGRGGGYRIYFDPQDEKMDFSPWDLESAFHPEEAFDCPFAEPCGVLARLCWADEDCFAAQRATVIALDDTLAGRDMVGLFDAANALTRATAVANPRDACTPVQLDEARARIRAWLETRSEAVRAGFAP